MKVLGIEVTKEKFDYLMCEQSNGKQLKVVDGDVFAVERVLSEEDLKQIKLAELQKRLNELSEDIIQIQCGAIFEDKEDRIAEFRDVHNELRGLLGKEPRIYLTSN